MNALYDILVGLVIGFILSLFAPWWIIILTVVFAILPDIDFLIYHATHPINRFSHKHRRILHLPLLYIPIGIAIIIFLNAPEVVIISFILGSLWHFMNDSISIGWGVQWLAPFSRRQFFWNKDIPTSKRHFLKVYSDTPKNIDAWADKHGDDHWMKKEMAI